MKQNRYDVVLNSSEAVVVDSDGKKIVACPTEEEARQYIKDFENAEGSVDDGV